MPAPTNCLRYWDISNHIRLTDAIALWCGVEPSELASIGIETQCMSAKRAALMSALEEGRLDYEDLGIVTSGGKVFKGAPISELIEKDRLVIKKDSLRRWFEQLPFEDRPPFLFDESREPVLPDGSDVVEMNSMKAIAIMAWLLAKAAPTYRVGDRPNAQNIGEGVLGFANDLFAGDTRGLQSFHKKVSQSLKLFERELPDSFRRN